MGTPRARSSICGSPSYTAHSTCSRQPRTCAAPGISPGLAYWKKRSVGLIRLVGQPCTIPVACGPILPHSSGLQCQISLILQLCDDLFKLFHSRDCIHLQTPVGDPVAQLLSLFLSLIPISPAICCSEKTFPLVLLEQLGEGGTFFANHVHSGPLIRINF